MPKRGDRKAFLWVIPMALLAALVVGCAGGISREARSQVTFADAFAELQQNPGRYNGETVLLGGRIIETRTEQGATELIVLQLPLNNNNRPVPGDQSQGRFIVHAKQFLDPAIYPPGTLITVVGRVTGSQDGTIGRMTYTYPVLEPVEMKKWEPYDQQSPRFHFGFGIGTRI